MPYLFLAAQAFNVAMRMFNSSILFPYVSIARIICEASEALTGRCAKPSLVFFLQLPEPE